MNLKNTLFVLCSWFFFTACGGNNGTSGNPDAGTDSGQPPLCASVNCDDRVSCTRDSCDEATGECRHQADHALCSGGTVCMPKEGCKSPPPCASDTDCPDTDNSPCMQEYCEPASSTCRWNPLDKDGDGHAPQICADIGGDDCDDDDRSRHPDAEEECNGVDDDCNGTVDDIQPGAGQPFYQDQDGDRYGNHEVMKEACSQPEGYVENGWDCDDSDYSRHPNAVEECNGVDDDCSGTVDDIQPGAGGAKFYQDQEGDGYGNPEVMIEACSRPDGYVENSEDCDDTDTNITDGCWIYYSSGLTWQNRPAEDRMNRMAWQEAVDYCENLTLAIHSDWRLPTISELRTMIRGCPTTESGGSCGLTDSCLGDSCWNEQCSGCDQNSGPADGCYWPNEMEGSCDWYWSSSYSSSLAWGVDFGLGGGVGYRGKTGGRGYVRCVRGGL